MASEMREARTGEKNRPKVLESLRIKHAENGGHIVEHQFDNSGPGYGYHEPENHVFAEGEGKKLVEHVKKHMKIKESAKSEGKTNVSGKNAKQGEKGEELNED